MTIDIEQRYNYYEKNIQSFTKKRICNSPKNVKKNFYDLEGQTQSTSGPNCLMKFGKDIHNSYSVMNIITSKSQ